MPKTQPRTPDIVRNDLVYGLQRSNDATPIIQLRCLRAVVPDDRLREFIVDGDLRRDDQLFGPSTDSRKLRVHQQTGNKLYDDKITNVQVDREALLAFLDDVAWEAPLPVEQRVAKYHAWCDEQRAARKAGVANDGAKYLDDAATRRHGDAATAKPAEKIDKPDVVPMPKPSKPQPDKAA